MKLVGKRRHDGRECDAVLRPAMKKQDGAPAPFAGIEHVQAHIAQIDR
jgi:hypothetical protein